MPEHVEHLLLLEAMGIPEGVREERRGEHRRQLPEVASEHHVDAAEGPVLSAPARVRVPGTRAPQVGVQETQELSRYGADLVRDEPPHAERVEEELVDIAGGVLPC